MTATHGEGLPDPVIPDALLHSPAPVIDLMDPKTAPAEMLDQVRVNTRQHRLETKTPLGTIAVETYWKMGEEFDGREEQRGDFFPALSVDLDPKATTNPLATQKYPYTILPDGSLYQMVVRVPLEHAEAPWSEERTRTISENSKQLFPTGMTLAAFRHAFPGVKVDLPDGRYVIEAKERTKPTLAIAARVEDGEPLARVQEVNGKVVRYKEISSGGFLPSGLHPDTAVALIDSRITLRPDSKEADRQKLIFKAHDGFQRTGEGAAEHSGLAEIIVMQGEATQYSGFIFTPYHSPIIAEPRRNGYGGYDSLGYGGGYFTPRDKAPLSFGATPVSFGGGLTGGETRYRAPETVQVSMTGVRNLRAIAAFRFAMTGSRA